MPTIHVVGSINQDIVAFVDRHPRPGETVLGQRSVQVAGGKGLNQAVAAARLSAAGAVRMTGRVGDDAFGSSLVSLLAAEGIETSGVRCVPGVGTGIALITVDAAAENTIAVVPGANHAWPDGLGDLALAARDIVVCQLEVPVDISAAAFAQARRVNAMTILNPAPHQPLTYGLLAATDVLVLNEIETAQLLGRTVDAISTRQLVPAARDILARGPRAVVVTLGASGALVVEAGGRALRLPAETVRAVDTTGAGDCFVGALSAALAADEELGAAAAFANRAAAISVARRGSSSSMPHRAEMSPR